MFVSFAISLGVNHFILVRTTANSSDEDAKAPYATGLI